MGGETWSISTKLCDSCKSAPANVFCRADSAFLCIACDAKIHSANKLASSHARVWMCDVCEQAPSSVTCKADAAALCVTCDRDIHSANPLARRHERFPVIPFNDSAFSSKSEVLAEDTYFSDGGGGDGDGGGSRVSDAEEAEAASWLLLNPNPNKIENVTELKATDYLFDDMESPYIDINLEVTDQKVNHHQQQYSAGTDGVVPVQSKNSHDEQKSTVVDGFPAYGMDYTGSKPFLYNFTTQSISHSLSSSSLDVGVVPDHGALADESNLIGGQNPPAEAVPTPVSGMDREARVLRYREKRKNRKFEKTIRYASRKAYAETRPRIKGRFAKRTEIKVESMIAADASYGVVPSY